MSGEPDCVACGIDLDHCHGTLVVHVDGGTECTDPACDDVDQVRHGLLVDCMALAAGCCAPVGLARSA